MSGDGISHRGPLAEIHDASPACAAHGALFGFVGVSALERRAEGFNLAERAVEQLRTLYGYEASDPIDVLVQDWANEEFTATEQDGRDKSQGHHL